MWWQIYLLGGLLFAILHVMGALAIEATEPPGGQSNVWWKAVGPDGGHELTVAWLNHYEFPMENLFDRLGAWSADSPFGDLMIVSGTNGLLLGICVVGILHAIWAIRRKF